MKVAYVFATTNCQKILSKMIVPQLEMDGHGAKVVGMFFFMDNTFMLVKGTEFGERLQALQEKTGILLMACDQCADERGITDNLIPAAYAGCFPGLYAALINAGGVDQVITL
ncbi:MAG: DsrE-related protein SaoD [Syntrophaceticus sp.]|jgi:sulfur relay (sulfurtransferase) complex TusBCD TusD component (DsrE family)|nr:DsrE-related protein SaoD [Syntrophaceticus sp.]MDD3315160.1 DsrE-related protein SaoD [Syntrophaceticus sp.]MDD4359486.1 DsrE-related protein SaoD [Syntrophaceticus sp.]MDD4783431.1 DsrE-related protein SaoD [Syntrophaceticus sp.]